MLSLAIVAVAAALPGALPAGTVVVGVAGVDDTATDIVAIVPSGEREVIGSLDHERGRIPKGTLTRDSVVTTSRVRDGTHTVVELTRLADGTRSIVATNAIETQPALVDASGAVLAVLEDERDPTSFHVAGAPFRGSWITPASSPPSLSSSSLSSSSAAASAALAAPVYLAIDLDGTNRIVTLVMTGAKTVPLADLGKGRYRSPVTVGANVLVEREIDRDRASLLANGVVVYEGLHGMDPKSCGGDVVAFGNGKKHAGVIFAHLAKGKLVDAHEVAGDGAGVASVLACAMVDGAPAAVAWLSKGASLPGELWAFSSKGAQHRLLEPSVGAAVEVYGIVDGTSEVRR